MIGLDLSGFDLDGPFPRHLADTDSARGVASRFKLVVDIVGSREADNSSARAAPRRARAAIG